MILIMQSAALDPNDHIIMALQCISGKPFTGDVGVCLFSAAVAWFMRERDVDVPLILTS